MRVLGINLHLSTFDHIEGFRRIPSLEKNGFPRDLIKTESFKDLFSFQLETNRFSGPAGKKGRAKFVREEINLSTKGSAHIGFVDSHLTGRKAEGLSKNKAFIKDSHARKHTRKRMDLYKSEGFPIKNISLSELLLQQSLS
jgi:hypothetical protein